MSSVDVSRAHLVKPKRQVYITLPSDDTVDGMCGIFQRAMYGTRDASQAWHDHHMEQSARGFSAGVGSPIFFLQRGAIDSTNHGDDSVTADRAGIYYVQQLFGEICDFKCTGVSCPDLAVGKESRHLNRVRWYVSTVEGSDPA